MPRLSPKQPKFKPDEVMVAWMPHVVGERMIAAGIALRATDEAVRLNPAYFHRADMPSEEIPSPWQAAVGREEEMTREHKSPALLAHEREQQRQIPAAEACVALQSFNSGRERSRQGSASAETTRSSRRTRSFSRLCQCRSRR